MKRTSRAITLVEVLIAVAIVFILCALIFAALGPAREKSRQRVCASNMHQWGTAFAMYIADYDGIDPQVGTPLTYSQLGLPPFSDALGFMKLYKIYGTGVMNCPSAHYPAATGHYGTRLASYDLQGFDTGDASSAQFVAAKGPNLTILLCRMHNTDIDFEDQPSWATKWVQWLTIDQHIQFKNMPVHAYP